MLFAADARIRRSVEPIGPQRGVATLSLREATGGDTGCYTLILTNPLGTDRLAASVTVEGRHRPVASNGAGWARAPPQKTGAHPQK